LVCGEKAQDLVHVRWEDLVYVVKLPDLLEVRR